MPPWHTPGHGRSTTVPWLSVLCLYHHGEQLIQYQLHTWHALVAGWSSDIPEGRCTEELGHAACGAFHEFEFMISISIIGIQVGTSPHEQLLGPHGPSDRPTRRSAARPGHSCVGKLDSSCSGVTGPHAAALCDSVPTVPRCSRLGGDLASSASNSVCCGLARFAQGPLNAVAPATSLAPSPVWSPSSPISFPTAASIHCSCVHCACLRSAARLHSSDRLACAINTATFLRTAFRPLDNVYMWKTP